MLPEVTVVRNQNDYNLKQLIDYSKDHTVFQEKGFISTSHNSIDEHGRVKIIYKNVVSKSIAPISGFADG
ncbi:MAG: hypothetical protein RCG15_08825 [Candidatus Rickettsia vulgarisii]